MQILKLILASLVLTTCQQTTILTLQPGSIHQAVNANDFIESIGVNTHVSYMDTAYGHFDDVLKPSLLYLGVRHIRDGLIAGGNNGLVLKRYRDLYAQGIQVTGVVPYQVKSMPALVADIKTQRDVLAALEGPNETDIFTQFNYNGQKFPKGTIAFMQDFYSAIKQDPQLQDLPVLQTTLAFPGRDTGNGILRADMLGNLAAYADYGNSHNYFSFGEIPSDRIKNDHLPLNSRITPGKPMMSSEGGYQMGESDGYKGNWDDGLAAPFSEDVHGRYLLRYVLEQYRLGYKRSFIYELIDIDQPQWGLFRADGMPRPAAYGIRNLIQLLSEGNWDQATKRWIVPSIIPSTLNYTISNATDSVHTLLFQKSQNAFYLVLWNEVKNWDSKTAKPIYSKDVELKLSVNQPVISVRTFLPLTGGIEPTATFDSSSVQLSVPDHPLIVEIKLK